jgi:hypothetical protein
MNTTIVFHGLIMLLLSFIGVLIKNLSVLKFNTASYTRYHGFIAGIWLAAIGAIYEKLSILSPYYAYICFALIIGAYLIIASEIIHLFDREETNSILLTRIAHFLFISAIILNIISIAGIIFAILPTL